MRLNRSLNDVADLSGTLLNSVERNLVSVFVFFDLSGEYFCDLRFRHYSIGLEYYGL